jgi:F5/8 type C domain-containing protein/pectate lyase-like protein
MPRVLRRLAATLALLLAATVLTPTPAKAASTITTYPLPSGYPASATFAMTADGVKVPVTALATDEGYHYAQFSTSGATQIKITVPSDITGFRITPAAVRSTASSAGRVLTINLSGPRYFIVAIDGQPALAIAADAPETGAPVRGGSGVRDLVNNYGADPTGATKATGALQRAIDDTNAAGGGTVYVPAGMFSIGNIVLRSNVRLYLAGGAVLRGTGVKADYTQHFFKDSLNLPGTWFITTAAGSSNISITGRGTIDANGRKLRSAGMISTLIFPYQTSNFLVDGIIGRDAGLWALVPARSDNVTIRNYKGLQTLKMTEDDAIDVVESQSVTVQHTMAISEDDTYSTKTWDENTDYSKTWPGTPEALRNVTFDDAVAYTFCAAFKVGQGTEQPQSDVVYRNGYVHDAARAIAIDHRFGPAPIDRVTYDRIEIEKITQTGTGPFWLQLAVSDGGRGLGGVRNVTLRDITVKNLGSKNSVIAGLASPADLDEIIFQRVTVPGVSGYASTLAQLKVPSTSNATDIMFLPNQPASPHNYAVEATATASTSRADLGGAAAGADGNLATRWDSGKDASGAYYPTAWYQLDLGTTRQVSRINLVWEAAYAKAFTIRTSTDGQNWTQRYAATNEGGGNRRISFGSASARYVRIDMTGRGSAYGYSLWEVGVWDK